MNIFEVNPLVRETKVEAAASAYSSKHSTLPLYF